MQIIENLKLKILTILKKQDKSIEDFALDCDLSVQGMYHILKNNDTKFSTIVKMANLLDVSILYFVKNENYNANEPPAQYLSVNELLEQCRKNNEFLLNELRNATQKYRSMQKNINS